MSSSRIIIKVKNGEAENAILCVLLQVGASEQKSAQNSVENENVRKILEKFCLEAKRFVKLKNFFAQFSVPTSSTHTRNALQRR